MFTELAIWSGLCLTTAQVYKKYQENAWKTKDLKPFINKFNTICQNNEDNKYDFLLIDGNITKYGAKLIVSTTKKDFTNLLKSKELLEAEFKTEIDIKLNDNKCTATIDIYTNKLTDDYKYKPIELKPYELLVSYDNHFEPIIANMHDQTHVLIGGTNGSGKSVLLQCMLINLIVTQSNKIDIYISNKTKSPDFRYIKNTSSVKGYVETIAETSKLLDYIMDLYNQRLAIINKHDCDNVIDYNKKFKSKQMNIIYIVIDEFAQYFPDNEDDEYNDKKYSCNQLKKMSEILRKAGIYLLISTQRPDTNSISPSMKCNLKTKIAFSQLNQASSLVMCDNANALVGLPNREFLYTAGSEQVYGRTLYLDKKMIQEYLTPYTVTDRNKLSDFNKFLKLETQDKPKQEKQKSIKSKKVIPISSEVASDKATRVKNIEVIENISYVVENGHILIRKQSREE